MEEMRPTAKGKKGGASGGDKWKTDYDEMRRPTKCRRIKGFSAADLVSILIDL